MIPNTLDSKLGRRSLCDLCECQQGYFLRRFNHFVAEGYTMSRSMLRFLGFVLAFGLFFAPLSSAFAADKCRYCASSAYGPGCVRSPHKKHEHIGDEKKCEFCGSSSYGPGCPHSPLKKHRHGHGVDKCVWCGSKSMGPGCPHSPTKKHER